MISTQYINLNMVPSGVMPVLHCSQYDVGRPLGVVIYNGSESVDLSGYTVTIEGTRTDRTPVTAGVTTDGNIGVFTATPTMTNENDTYRAKVVLTDNAGRVSSLAFVMCVDEKTMDENAEEIEEDASLYQQYTGTVQTIIAQIRGDLAAEITARQNAVSAEATARQNAISAEASARQSADNTLQSNINAEASARATEDASLQSQIDQLVAPSGEAPSAAEVQNARIGSDGTVYPTLGDAIRTQNSLLKSHLEVIDNTVGKGTMSFLGTGNTHSSNSDVLYIVIKAGEKFTVRTWNSANIGTSAQVYAKYKDGTEARIVTIDTSNAIIELTAENDIVGIGLYQSTINGVTYHFEVVRNEWICNPLAEEINNVIRLSIYRNGSGGNAGNTKLVTARAIPLVSGAVKIAVRNPRPVSAVGNYYRYDISAFKGWNWYANRKTGVAADNNEELYFTNADIIATTSGVTAFGITVHEYNSAGVEQTLRYGDFEDYPLIVRYVYDDHITSLRDIDNQTSGHDLLNARHCTNPLTILHFSDLHADTAALKRIIDDANYYYGTNIDDKICTGDMVGSTYAEIASWWDASVLTCIGNHDSASYSGGAYNWTALSMADRDAYYIAPFESGWGITHTSGTSYYYKDYATQKVRLIVIDAMLYTGTPGAEAETQTTWLANLLSDAITNGYHVLIAIHAPHGGATAKDCSFSRYGQGTMPTYTDCNTPQTVIDTVAAAITNGLHFIGYIVGHAHQDNIWDAEDDAKQLMYCVTCAAQATKAQWQNSDQDRSGNVDAYNIVTIDTAKTLVKIVRGGGADIDDHMRTRKAICINYTTGTVVGEVL